MDMTRRNGWIPIALGCAILIGAALTATAALAQEPPTEGGTPGAPDATSATETDGAAEGQGTGASPAVAGGGAGSGGTEAAGGAGGGYEASSDAERIVRIRRGIKLDKQKLRELRVELRTREAWFERLATGMTDVETRLGERRDLLKALGPDEDTEEAADLKQRIAELQEDYDLFNRQTDLALTGERKTKLQIDALADKIKTDERSLAELTGQVPARKRPPPSSPKAPAPTTGSDSTPLPPGVPPGVAPGAAPTSAPAAPPSPDDVSSEATAAQLRAQQLLRERRRELEHARFEVENFVERKRALETQIELEDALAATEEDEVENLIKARTVWQARLDEAKEAGNQERAKRAQRAVTAITEYVDGAKDDAVKRAKYRETLKERLGFSEEEGLRVNAVADEAQKAVRKAKRQLIWLKSPVHPENILHWAKQRGPRILLVIVMMGLLLFLLQISARGLARTFIRRRRGSRSGGTGRADTLAFSFSSLARVLIIVIGVLLVLQEAGLDIRTVLGGAAILGVAFAFGAQDLMRDYFSGFLILLEDQYQLGDLITINGITGTVESVNMRVTVLRDLEGRVHFVPNGEIKAVTNRTYAWGRPVFEIPVSYSEDVDRVMAVLLELAHELMSDPEWKPFVSGEPDMLGVDKFTDRGVVIKFMIRTQPDKLFPVRREMLRRISKRFNELGIQITVPQRMLEIKSGDGPSSSGD